VKFSVQQKNIRKGSAETSNIALLNKKSARFKRKGAGYLNKIKYY